jgi:hypothetical protein
MNIAPVFVGNSFSLEPAKNKAAICHLYAIVLRMKIYGTWRSTTNGGGHYNPPLDSFRSREEG